VSTFRVEPLGEDALLLRFADTIDADANRRVYAMAAAIARARPDWLRELVPGYASLALAVDPDAPGDADPLARICAWLETLPPIDAHETEADAPAVVVPVCYGCEFGPDIEDLARHAGLTPEDAIQRHAAGDYRVAMVGFAPGFPYLLGLDPALAMPRLRTPRTRVAAGSVGIGGAQTGIYPREGPGGWRIIGRTPVSLFDAARPAPSLLAPGQRLRFESVDADTFARLAAQRHRIRR
jgi:KipI family sensor histidine kinase inhibitor